MHVFDPATGRNLSLSADDGVAGSSSAPAAPRHAAPDDQVADDASAGGQTVVGDASPSGEA
jgi:hypothetical protein